MKLLFIEDNITKAEDIRGFLCSDLGISDIVIKESFTSGLKEVFTGEYDALLLDMSLPTRDGSPNNSINNFEQLGGHKILSELKRKKKKIPTILITMFSEFGIGKTFMDMVELDEVLKKNFKPIYKGYVYYSSKEETWRKNLSELIEKL